MVRSPVVRLPERDYKKLTPDQVQKIGFMAGYHPYDASQCMCLNDHLAHQLSALKPYSMEWYAKAKEFHKHAKQFLRCCG